MVIAEAIVSVVLTQLSSITAEELKKHGKLVLGAAKDVEKLISTFSAIGALLLDAEEKASTDPGIRDWLKKLEDVSYEIDDVLDEWRTKILKRQLEGGGGGDQHARHSCLELKLLRISDVLKRACCFLPTKCGKIGFLYNTGSRAKSLNERLDDIDTERSRYTNLTPRDKSSYTSLQTSPNINFSKVKGREEELKILRHRLLDEKVKSMSIQGPGGFGKTTLAKMLYNDKAVEAHFDKRIWVCVSNHFDQATVAKSILESFKQYTQGSTVSHMWEEIKAHTKGKKFLLVLDDVWEKVRTNWDELIDSLSDGLHGSKILLTTRIKEASQALYCEDDDILLLQKISKDACQAIFTQIAFYGWSDDERERIEEDLCERVVEKCSGSPLAAKVLGGVLHVKRSEREWLGLLKSEMWEIKEGREEVLAPIALSYYDLPPAIRQCFQFSSVFPQDYEMEKDELIKLWMSQGFLKETTNQDTEEVGEEYFHTLVMRSFFQDVGKKWTFEKEKTLCKMHDLVHDFARLTTKNECISIMRQDSSLPLNINEARHLMTENLSSEGTNILMSSIISSRLSSTKSNNYLRSFTVKDGSAIEPIVYGHLRGIRSLILYYCDMIEISSTISQLIHLRHLDLSGNMKLMGLPKEICELYNLETLLLNNNTNLKKLPSGMGNKLVNLKHLENFWVPAVLPRSMARLGNSLKTLTTFNVEADAEGATNVGDLERMNRVQGSLRIAGLGNVTNCEEVKRAEIAKKESLTRLCLEFRGIEEEAKRPSSSNLNKNETIHKEEQVLEAIKTTINKLGSTACTELHGRKHMP